MRGRCRTPRRKRAALWLLSAVMLVTALCPAGAWADQNGEKTVRVGYVNALNYEEGGEGEYKRGAGYEYLQKISYLTGWKYEYVYGSFTECMDMLAKGEIDLFGNVSYTAQRAETVDFSAYPQGKDTYWLYTGKGRSDLATGGHTGPQRLPHWRDGGQLSGGTAGGLAGEQPFAGGGRFLQRL